ncbi:hypothetical protein KBY93_09295 [Synechococcus sp. J7-Johnson]|uniref:hypothetical protein n=1 Tax=Synechococcus sp. J7-Johnson TaxID=2823737 RepID=UPI0020CEDC9C|nr:hypothetical protein [Synechococcus sp. J7-Johnson]MCP9840829.1 hypothetical protein [Synechococcus sp. J7-Johnson]
MALAVLSGLAHLRLKHHLGARRVSGGGQASAAGLEGCLAGLALWLFLLVVGGGEPSVTPSLLDRVIGFGVMGALGAASSLGLWSMAAWIQRRVPTYSRLLKG